MALTGLTLPPFRKGLALTGAAVGTLQETVGTHATTVASLQEKVGSHETAVGTLRTQLEAAEQEIDTRVRLRILRPTATNSIHVRFDNTVGYGEISERRFCPAGHYICGLTQIVEPAKGKNVDDTAMNGMEFYCCPLAH